MSIRDLILSQDPEIALQELRFQWSEMAAQTNDVINQFSVSRDGVLKGPENTVASSISVSTTLSYATRTVSVTTSGKTISLPAASANLVGQDWTIHLGVTGNVTIARQGSDTICTPYSATDTSVQLITLGDSATFRCLTATTWGMV